MGSIRIFSVIVCSCTALAGRAGAQGTPVDTLAKRPPYERGCRGDGASITLSATFHAPLTYPVVNDVDPQSPAGVAGVQVGDTIVAQGGVDLLQGRPPLHRYAVGDTIHLVVHRAGTPHDIAIVLGRRTPATPGTAAVCRPAANVPAAH